MTGRTYRSEQTDKSGFLRQTKRLQAALTRTIPKGTAQWREASQGPSRESFEEYRRRTRAAKDRPL